MKKRIPEFNLTSINTIFIIKELNGNTIRISRNVPESFFHMEPVTDEILYDKEKNVYWNKKSDIIYDSRIKRKFFQEEYINITESLLEKRKLENKLLLDALTQIPNITAVQQKEFEMIKNNKSYVIAMCDINDFKTINDTQGHQMGDKILIDVAQKLNDSIRANEDIVARVGGDEFLFIFETENVETILEKLITVKKAVKDYGENMGFPVSISIGAALLPKNDDKLIRTKDEIKIIKEKADKALYHIKNNAKSTDNIGYYYPDTNEIGIYSLSDNKEKKKKIGILTKHK